jgi:hypothetical protein
VAKQKVGFENMVSADADIYDTLALINKHVNTDCNSGFVKDVVTKLGPIIPNEDFMHRVFDYYCRNVKYKLDEKGTEKVYTPARTIHEGAGDCKKAATFLASVLKCAGLNPILKHVYYDGNEDFTHIYVIVPNPDLNNYITLDPTNNCQWNKEVSYSGGGLYYLNGKSMKLKSMGAPAKMNFENSTLLKNLPFSEEMSIGCHMTGLYIEATSENMLGAKPKPVTLPKGGGHAIIKSLIPQGTNPAVLRAVQNIPIESQRGGLLELIQNNAGGIATSLAVALGTNPKALDTVWGQVGGDINALKAEIIKAAKIKPAPIPATVTPTTTAGPQYVGGPMYIGKFSLGHLLHSASALLHIVAAVANIVAPGSGAAIDALAGKGDQVANVVAPANAPPPPPPPGIKPDPNGHLHESGHAGHAVGLTATIMALHLLPLQLSAHNYLGALVCAGVAAYSPFYFNKYYPIKKIWLKLLRQD